MAWLLDHSNLDVPDIDSVPAAPCPPPLVVPMQVEEARDDDYEGDGEGQDDDDSSSEDSDGFELNVDTAAVTGTHVQSNNCLQVGLIRVAWFRVQAWLENVL